MNKQKLRKCEVHECECLFHRWVDHASVVPPSPMAGGTPGGQIKYTLGIVEKKEDGLVFEAYPSQIKFID